MVREVGNNPGAAMSLFGTARIAEERANIAKEAQQLCQESQQLCQESQQACLESQQLCRESQQLCRESHAQTDRLISMTDNFLKTVENKLNRMNQQLDACNNSHIKFESQKNASKERIVVHNHHYDSSKKIQQVKQRMAENPPTIFQRIWNWLIKLFI